MVDDPLRLTRHNYVQVTALLLWDNLPRLLLASLFFSLLWAPTLFLSMLGLWVPMLFFGWLLTFPGWSALLALEAALAEGRRAPISLFWRSFGRLWARSVGLGAALGLPIGIAWLTLLLAGQAAPPPPIAWAGLVADGMVVVLLACLALYAVPLFALHDQRLGQALRNSLILASRHVTNTFGLLAMGVLCVLSIFTVSPGLLFVLPAVWGMFLINNCRMLVAEETGQL